MEEINLGILCKNMVVPLRLYTILEKNTKKTRSISFVHLIMKSEVFCVLTEFVEIPFYSRFLFLKYSVLMGKE